MGARWRQSVGGDIARHAAALSRATIRVLAVAGLMLAIACLLNLGVQSAAAEAAPQLQPIDDPAYENTLGQLIQGPWQAHAPSDAVVEPSADVIPLEIAAEGAAELPPLGLALGTVAVPALAAVGAFTVGLMIGRGIDKLFFNLHGNVGGYDTSAGTFTNPAWQWVQPNAGGYWQPVNNGYPGGVWDFQLNYSPDSTIGTRSLFGPCDSACAADFTSSGHSGEVSVINAFWTEAQKMVGVNGSHFITVQPSMSPCAYYGITASDGCGQAMQALVMDPGSMESAIMHSGPVPYTNQATTKSYTMPTTNCGATSNNGPCQPATTMSGPQIDNARTILKSQLTDTTTINHYLDPAGYPLNPVNPTTPLPTAFVLPEPYLNETAAMYRQRLRDLGYLGNVTLADDPMAAAAGSPLMALNPDSVTEVEVTPDPSTPPVEVPRYSPDGQPIDWPSAPPVVDPGTTPDITIVRVPLDYAPVPESPGEPLPHDDPPPEDIPPDTPPRGGSIDFTPLTNLNFGCKFPYGFVCYAKEVSQLFDGGSVGPDFNLTVADTNIAGGITVKGYTYDANLGANSAINEYMGYWRDAVSWALWIGAVYVMATRFLNFWGAGDPGASIDDADF